MDMLRLVNNVNQRDGDYYSILVQIESHVTRTEALGDYQTAAWLYQMLGFHLRLVGDYQGSCQTLERALHLFRATHIHLSEHITCGYLWVTLMEMGNYAEAMRVLETAAAQGREHGLGPYHTTDCEMCLCKTLAAQGKHAEAQGRLHELLMIAQSISPLSLREVYG